MLAIEIDKYQKDATLDMPDYLSNTNKGRKKCFYVILIYFLYICYTNESKSVQAYSSRPSH